MSAFTLRLPGAAPGSIRVAVKDIIDMEGLPTTSGSQVLAERAEPATADAACLAGIRAGRASIVGRTNLHELAYGITGINPWFGTPVNPLDPSRCPGGSSSGSAVAVGTGEVAIALGTDTGGSVRIPAACCGIVGLKTTFGRIPTTGVKPLGPTLDTVGPMAADVTNTALGMQLLEPGFTWRDEPPAQRIGRLRLAAADWVNAAIDAALAEAGIETVDISMPSWDTANEAFGTILGAEVWQVHRHLWETDAGRLSPDVSARIVGGADIDPAGLDQAKAAANRWNDELAEILKQVDAIALPVLADEPPTIEEAATMGQLRYTGPINVAGVPALAMPVPGSNRFPASLQLVGPDRSEGMLLATGAIIEAAVAR